MFHKKKPQQQKKKRKRTSYMDGQQEQKSDSESVIKISLTLVLAGCWIEKRATKENRIRPFIQTEQRGKPLKCCF